MVFNSNGCDSPIGLMLMASWPMLSIHSLVPILRLPVQVDLVEQTMMGFQRCFIPTRWVVMLEQSIQFTKS